MQSRKRRGGREGKGHFDTISHINSEPPTPLFPPANIPQQTWRERAMLWEIMRGEGGRERGNKQQIAFKMMMMTFALILFRLGLLRRY